MKKYVWLLPCIFALGATAQTPVGNPTGTIFNFQAYNRPENCLPCHQRQYDELASSVKSGYRSVSPLMNGLESSGNLINGGLLRPTYPDSTVVLPDGTPLNSNMFTTSPITEIRQDQSGFCFTCHDAEVLRMGNNPATREVPQLAGLAAAFQPTLFRPLRDYMLVDSNGNQVLPATPGGPPPAGALPSLGAASITCDVCHNVAGPDINRSFQRDGFANQSLLLNESEEKVGPFSQPVAVKGDFHISSNDQNKISFLVSGAFCNACHDVRVPAAAPGDFQHLEYNTNPGGSSVTYYRLENLSTEWQIGPLNSTNNPFGKIVTCQDCHMSKFPFGPPQTITVNDIYNVQPSLQVSAATGGYFTNFAAVPGISTDQNYPLQQRTVVSHYFTGVDVPLASTSDLQARLGPQVPDPYQAGTDEYGIPLSLAARRQALLDAATRVSLAQTDQTATLGGQMTVRVEAVDLAGHRFPAGFSQERTAYVQMSVTDDNGFVLYQSGYVVDKPHPDTGETAPDGNLDDEDLEHVHAVVDGGRFITPYATGAGNNGGLNLVFELGPDNGPDSRVYEGAHEGLVLFRNELTRVFLPGSSLAAGRASVTQPHYEETFNASLATTVDNFRSLQPFAPRTFLYDITLPTQAELSEMGVTLRGPLHVHAQVNYEHFPPLFMRYLAKVTGPGGPTGAGLNLLTESTIDTYLRNLRSISSDDFTVQLEGVQ